ncbi:MAG: helix-turn-helix domain-containing protein, partial [Nitrospiria bacterium]
MTKASDKSIGLRIRTIRKRLGLNQTRFGKLFGVTQEAVSGWENGAYPDGLRLLEISKCGHTRIEWILTGDPFWRFGPVSDKVMNKIRSDPAERHYIRCPLLHEHVASGPPKEIGDEDIAESLWMPSEIGHQRNYLMRVRDGAMEPIFKK